MKKILYLPITAGFILLSNLNSALAMESLVPCGPTKGNMCTLCDFVLLAKNIFDFLLKISLAAAILFVSIAGILYIVSAGSENLMKIAKTAMTYALVGFSLCLAAWLLTHIVASLLGYKASWWKLEMDCGDFGINQRKINCEGTDGTWNPDTSECECLIDGTELFRNKYCIATHLIPKIEECEDPNKGQNQQWDYNTNECVCADGFLKNDDGNCVDIQCWNCWGTWIRGTENKPCFHPCVKETFTLLEGCVPGPSCGTITFGKIGTPCGVKPGSTCQKDCQYGEDLNVIKCKNSKCCLAGKQNQANLSECDKCKDKNASSIGIGVEVDIANDKSCTIRPDGNQRTECILSGGKCIPNPDVCK